MNNPVKKYLDRLYSGDVHLDKKKQEKLCPRKSKHKNKEIE